MESADSDKLGLGIELVVAATVFEDSEVTTPAAKLLLVKRGGGMFQQTTNASYKTRTADTKV